MIYFRLERPSHCHPDLYKIISKCWAGDMNKRPDFTELRLVSLKFIYICLFVCLFVCCCWCVASLRVERMGMSVSGSLYPNLHIWMGQCLPSQTNRCIKIHQEPLCEGQGNSFFLSSYPIRICLLNPRFLKAFIRSDLLWENIPEFHLCIWSVETGPFWIFWFLQWLGG